MPTLFFYLQIMFNILLKSATNNFISNEAKATGATKEIPNANKEEILAFHEHGRKKAHIENGILILSTSILGIDRKIRKNIQKFKIDFEKLKNISEKEYIKACEVGAGGGYFGLFCTRIKNEHEGFYH